MTQDTEVAILNVGAGDTKLSFDPSNPQEVIRASRIVKDMLRRGYALLVRDADGKYVRATGFDEKTAEYIIADFDPVEAERADAEEAESAAVDNGGEQNVASTTAPKGKTRGRTRKIPAAKTRAVAVARTAGG